MFANSMKKFFTFMNIEKVCNFAYRYLHVSHKRTNALKEFLEVEHEDMFNLSYIFSGTIKILHYFYVIKNIE